MKFPCVCELLVGQNTPLAIQGGVLMQRQYNHLLYHSHFGSLAVLQSRVTVSNRLLHFLSRFEPVVQCLRSECRISAICLCIYRSCIEEDVGVG